MRRFLTIILFYLFFACSYNIQESNEHLRPSGIPDSAFWSGGPDGGNWYVIHFVNDHKNGAYISVYGEDGELIVKKNFFVVCRIDKPVVIINDLKSQISAFDGEKIVLSAPSGKEVCWMQ